LISQTVEVTEVNSEYLLLKPVREGCQSCASGSCGVSNIAQLFGNQSRTLKIENHHHLYHVGDVVELLLDEKLFMKSVSMQYLLPLLAMFCFAVVAGLVSQHLVFQLIASVLGLVTGIVISRVVIRWYEYRVDGDHLQIRPLATS
jgi:positive regulator of sigma E activity